MKLSLHDRIGAGAFADVFAPAPGDRAFKLFRRLDDAYRREAPVLFADECAAYRIAMREETIRPYVPAFHGPVVVTSVANTAGLDVSSGYWLNLCYSMERLAADPHERKVRTFFGTPDWRLIEPIQLACESVGIGRLADASVLHWRSGTARLVDFGVVGAIAKDRSPLIGAMPAD
jgi:hypothetical protein